MSVQEIYEAACFQDIGTRKEQQDRVEILRSDVACLVILADGLGGHARGAFAAQTVIDVASAMFKGATRRQSPAADLLQAIVTNAHERINPATAGKPSLREFPGGHLRVAPSDAAKGDLDAPGRQPALPFPGWPDC